MAIRGNYLSMDCPSCGRRRIWAYVDGDLIKVYCDKCEANEWDCDDEEHSRVEGPHPQKAIGYRRGQDTQSEGRR